MNPRVLNALVLNNHVYSSNPVVLWSCPFSGHDEKTAGSWIDDWGLERERGGGYWKLKIVNAL